MYYFVKNMWVLRVLRLRKKTLKAPAERGIISGKRDVLFGRRARVFPGRQSARFESYGERTLEDEREDRRAEGEL